MGGAAIISAHFKHGEAFISNLANMLVKDCDMERVQMYDESGALLDITSGLQISAKITIVVFKVGVVDHN